MPELPEVETLARGIERVIVGRRIDAVHVGSERIIRDCPSKEYFVSSVLGCVVVAVGRVAKYLTISLEAPEAELVLVMHMGMSGQLRSSKLTGDELLFDRHSHLRFDFDDASSLAFYDPRTFGRAYIDFDYYQGRPISLSKLGPDALVSQDPLSKLTSLAARRSMPIKFQLLDQSLISGIGNMYGDEILFEAKINPFVTFADLSETEVSRLRSAIGSILARAIEMRGSSLADRSYRDVAGELGDYQRFHNVYARSGQPCNRCDTLIERVVMKGRSTFFCPSCQIASDSYRELEKLELDRSHGNPTKLVPKRSPSGSTNRDVALTGRVVVDTLDAKG
ncbi:MAG: bifunctional DNA-formamidopyrimidine glycosylase/DNA-(apurinic or apyrimidinic site) lyase [Actinomycetota bacterium]|nr:bifunctional DNA-formamidopyrimidine glycosylase/DNA-(apurinic or apyrimidinic site) lyase [Actinomycetota bacterium]